MTRRRNTQNTLVRSILRDSRHSKHSMIGRM